MRLSSLDAQFNKNVLLAIDKAKALEINVKKQVQAVTTTIATKVETCVTTEVKERRLQEPKSLKVCIQGIPP